jgi:hypothetical protein
MDWSKVFRDARKTVEEIEQQERRIAPKKLDDETWPEYLQRTRANRRELLLNVRIPERRCPVCSSIKVRSRQWVIISQRLVQRLSKYVEQGLSSDETAEAFSKMLLRGACCRACYVKYFVNKGLLCTR